MAATAQDAFGRAVQSGGRIEKDDIVTRLRRRLEERRQARAVLQARTPLRDFVGWDLPGHDNIERLDFGFQERLIERHAGIEDFIKSGVRLGAGRKRQPHGTLRIGIDEKCLPPALGEGESEINGAGCLAHAPF
jgi:hypothetical protein